MIWQCLWLRIQSWGFAAFATIVLAAAALLLFWPQFQRRQEMHRELERLDSELIRQEALEKQQRQEIELLKTDPTYVERTARNKLNLARPNEIIFRFEPPPGTTPATPR